MAENPNDARELNTGSHLTWAERIVDMNEFVCISPHLLWILLSLYVHFGHCPSVILDGGTKYSIAEENTIVVDETKEKWAGRKLQRKKLPSSVYEK